MPWESPIYGPVGEHLLGTNDVGQDIFSELIYGTRVSMLIGFFTAFIVTILATGLALLAGYYGGWVDRVVTALTNITMALPNLALTVLLVAYLNPGKLSVIIAISLTAWTGTTRILRARVTQLCQLPFVKIEKALGGPGRGYYGQAPDPQSQGHHSHPGGPGGVLGYDV